MWLFEKGVLGVVIVVLSLIASVLFGLVINVNSETVERDTPEYVSDITGLYQAQSDQTYVDYNPAANFNGYALGDNVFTYPNSGTRSVQTIEPYAEGGTYIQYGTVPLYADRDIYYINTSQSVTLYHSNGTTTGTEFGPFVRTSATTWAWGAITVDTANFRLVGNAGTVYTVQYKTVQPITMPDAIHTYVYSMPAGSLVRVTNGGTTSYIPFTSAGSCTVTSSDVTVGGTTYPATAVAMTSSGTSLDYNDITDSSYTFNSSGFSSDNIGTLNGDFTASDVQAIVTAGETANTQDYGVITITGLVTATNGADTYVGPRTFYKTTNGWVGDIGNMDAFTYTTASAGAYVYGYTYYSIDLNGPRSFDITISAPISVKLIKGTDLSSPYKTYSYYYATPSDGHITVSTLDSDLKINGTTVDSSTDILGINICPGTTSTSYSAQSVYYTPGTTAINGYTSSSSSGQIFNQHNISYGNGIPDDQQYGFYMIQASEMVTLTDVTGTNYNRNFGPYYANTDTTWKWSARTASTTAFSVSGSASTIYTVTSIGFTQIVIPYDYEMTVPAGNTVVKMLINGTNVYLHMTAQFTISKTANVYTVNGNAYNDVSEIYVSTYDAVSLEYTANINTYPVDFNASSVANNYRFSYEEYTSVTVNRNIDTYTVASTFTNPIQSYPYNGSVNIANPWTLDVYVGSFNGWYAYYKEVNLETLINEELRNVGSIAPFADKIIIDFPMTVIKSGSSADIAEHVSWTLSYAFVNNPIVITTGADRIGSDPYTADTLWDNYDAGDIIHLTCEYSLATETCVVYYGENATPIYTLDRGNMNGVKVYYPYGGYSGTNQATTTAWLTREYDTNAQYTTPLPTIEIPCTNAMTVTYESPQTVAYLDARFGVNVRNGEQVEWQNGYSNEVISYTALLGSADGSGNIVPDLSKNYMTQWEFTYQDMAPSDTPAGSRSSIKMVHQANGPTVFYFDDYGTPAYTYEFGSSWVGFVVTVNGPTGKVSIAPISTGNWTSFLVNTPESPTVMDYTLRNKGDIEGMVISVPGQMTGGEYTYTPVRFQVMNTRVFLNTYGVIKVDATLNIQAYYPLNEKYMITIHDTAAVGSHITIAGTTYPIEDNSILINGKRIDVTEMTLSYYKQSNDLYTVVIESQKSKESVTLENISDTTLGFTGAWYFESDYYKIELKQAEEYFWHPESLGYGYTGIVLFMMAFLGVISIIWWKVRPEMFGALDIAIIIGAEIILFIILG